MNLYFISLCVAILVNNFRILQIFKALSCHNLEGDKYLYVLIILVKELPLFLGNTINISVDFDFYRNIPIIFIMIFPFFLLLLIL